MQMSDRTSEKWKQDVMSAIPRAASNIANRRYGRHGHVYMHYHSDKIMERLKMCDNGDGVLLRRIKEGGVYTSAPEGNVKYAPDDPWRKKPPVGQQVYELVLFSATCDGACTTIYASFGGPNDGYGSLWFDDPRPLSEEGKRSKLHHEYLRAHGLGYLL